MTRTTLFTVSMTPTMRMTANSISFLMCDMAETRQKRILMTHRVLTRVRKMIRSTTEKPE
jgi:hypothetical protein